MKTFSTLTELDRYIANIDEVARSHYLVYSIYEAKDNANIIRALASQVTHIEQNDMQNFVRLIMEHRCDEQNLDIFMQTDSIVSRQLEAIVNAM